MKDPHRDLAKAWLTLLKSQEAKTIIATSRGSMNDLIGKLLCSCMTNHVNVERVKARAIEQIAMRYRTKIDVLETRLQLARGRGDPEDQENGSDDNDVNSTSYTVNDPLDDSSSGGGVEGVQEPREEVGGGGGGLQGHQEPGEEVDGGGGGPQGHQEPGEEVDGGGGGPQGDQEPGEGVDIFPIPVLTNRSVII
jgi:hypothetical protein